MTTVCFTLLTDDQIATSTRHGPSAPALMCPGKLCAAVRQVERAEALVLESFDWTIPVQIWCIECDQVTPDILDPLMDKRGYERVQWPEPWLETGAKPPFWAKRRKRTNCLYRGRGE